MCRETIGGCNKAERKEVKGNIDLPLIINRSTNIVKRFPYLTEITKDKATMEARKRGQMKDWRNFTSQ